MVNPYTDPRYAMARLMRQQSAGGQVSANPLLQGPPPGPGAIRLGRAANDAVLNNPSLRQQIEAISGGKPAGEPKGAMGAVLGNPITKVALNALGTLAIPGRATVAGIREIADILDSDPNTRASFSDLRKNVADPTFGFGKAFKINTGSKWLDRAIGFVGDVALDPLTYATFGAGKFAGYSGRLKLGQEVLRNTGDNALATAVAREGRRALRNNPEVLERVGANKFGVYFFGKRVKVGPGGKGIRVPMSGQIAQIGESTIAKMRLALTDTRAGKYVQKLTMPKDMLDARLKLARGLVSPEEGADYLRFFDMIPKERAARAAALQAFEQQVVNLIKSEEIGGLENYRSTIYKILENPALLETASAAEQRGYAVWRAWFDEHAQNIQNGIKSVDPEANIEMRANYFPRTMTDDAIRYMRGDGVHSETLRTVFMEDPFAKPGAFTPRTLVPGKKFFGKLLTEEDMSTDALNKIARDAGFEGDFFETDIVQAARKYIYDAADEIGIIERNKVLVETNFFKRLEDAKVTKLEVDEEAVARARMELDGTRTVLEGADEELRKSLDDLVASVRAESKAVSSQVVAQEAGVENIIKYLFDSKENIARLGDLVEQSKARLAQLMGEPGEIRPYALSDDFPSVAEPVLRQFDAITEEIRRYETLIANAHSDVSLGRLGVAAGMDVRLAEIEDAAARLFTKYSEARESIESALEFSNALQANWDSMVIGRNLGGSGGVYSMLKTIKDILETSSATSSKVARERAKALGVTGSLKDFLRGVGDRSPAARYFDQEFADIAGSGGVASLKRANVDMSEVEFLRRINNALSEDITIDELREAAVYAIGRDIRLYNAGSFDELPEVVKEFHRSLRTTLNDALQAERIRDVMSKSRGIGDLQSLESRLGPTYQKAMGILKNIEEYDDFIRYIDGPFKDAYDSTALWDDAVEIWDTPVTREMLDALENGAAIGSGKTGNARRMPWLDKYVDEETPFTLRQVVDAVKVRREQVRQAFDNEKISIALSEKEANLMVGAEAGSRTRETTYAEVVQRYRRERSEILGKEEKDLRVSGRLMDQAMNPEAAKVELAQRLLTYQAVSNAVVKFEAIAGLMSVHGLVPTEDMWKGILRTVSAQYGPQFKSKFVQTTQAEEALHNLRRMFNEEMERVKKLPTEEQPSPSFVFESALKKVMDSPEGESVREIIGPSLAGLYDPFDMRRRVKDFDSTIRSTKAEIARTEKEIASAASAGEKRSLQSKLVDLRAQLGRSTSSRESYLRNFVIPWAKGVNPRMRADIGPAIKTLKARVGNAPLREFGELGSPLSAAASEAQINRWFLDLFGYEKNLADSWDVVGGNLNRTVEDGVVRVRGSIGRMQDEYMKAQSFFDKMNDGFLDVEAFFTNPGAFQKTPSGYAAMMTSWANYLDTRLGFIEEAVSSRPGAPGITEGSGLLDLTPSQARRPAERAVGRTQKAFENAEVKAARARQIDAAFRDPELTDEDLAALGFTKTMRAARDAVLEHNAFRATLEYAKAVQDQEMVSFLDAVAGVDFSKFSDGIVVGVQRSPIYADSVAASGTEAAAKRLEDINGEIASLRTQLESGRNAINQKHMNADGTWKSPESANYARIELQQWDQTAGRRIERRISAMETEAEEASNRIGRANTTETVEPLGTDANGRTIVGYEEQPVWATMPDGKRLVFTTQEWASLYLPPLTAVDANKLRAANRELTSQIRSLEKELQARSVAVGNATPNARRRTRQLEATLQSMKEEYNANSVRLRSATAEIRNSALEKVRILTTQQAGEPRVIEAWIDAARTSRMPAKDMTSDTYWMLRSGRPSAELDAERVGRISSNRASAFETLNYYTQKTTGGSGVGNYLVSDYLMPSTARRAGLQNMWSKNPSYRVLQRDAELAKSAASEPFVNAEKTARMLSRAAEEARILANRASREYDTVERIMRESLEAMRSEEFGAARAAGAQFDVADEFVDLAETVGAPVRYTLNGKQYTIPSVADMLQNPDKYINQARKRGDFFFDLRQKGNVAMWRDMDEQARSVAALGALHAQVIGAKATGEAYRINMINPTVGRIEEVEALIRAWSSDVNTLRESLDSVRQALKQEQDLARLDIANTTEELVGAKLDFFELGEEIRALYGADFDITTDSLGRVENRLATLRSQEALLKRLSEDAPSPQGARSMLEAKRPSTRERWREVFQGWVEDNRQTLAALAEADLMNPGERKVWDAWMRAQTAEARFIREQASMRTAQEGFDTASAGVMVEKVIKPFEREFSRVAKDILDADNLRMADDLNMPSFAVNREVMQVLNNLTRAREGAMVRELGRFMGQYTGFFKAYATLTPGFHVRNAISNTFQLFAAGASPIEMSRGLKLYRSMGEFIKKGGTYEDWLMTLPEATRARARIAGDVTLGLGGGNVDDAFREFVNIGRGRLVDNVATRTSRKLGRHVEGSARFMLAWDSAVRGDDFVESFNRTKRFLFDYNDPTILDETVRNVIPFWTWMSRNLPLQLVNQWANPRPYLVYQRFVNNFGAGENDVIPSYMKETGHAIKLGGGLWMSPDLPHSRVRQQIEGLANPTQLMSYVNPGLRVPVELMGNKKTFNNAPFTGEYKPITGQYLPFMPLLQALGQVEYTQDGRPVMTDRAQYALTSMLPMLGQAERLMPSTDTGDGLALARYVGVPLRRVDSAAEDRVKLGRLSELQRMLDQQKKINEAYGE